jgi:hypothetical protein
MLDKHVTSRGCEAFVVPVQYVFLFEHYLEKGPHGGVIPVSTIRAHLLPCSKFLV